MGRRKKDGSSNLRDSSNTIIEPTMNERDKQKRKQASARANGGCERKRRTKGTSAGRAIEHEH